MKQKWCVLLVLLVLVACGGDDGGDEVAEVATPTLGSPVQKPTAEVLTVRETMPVPGEGEATLPPVVTETPVSVAPTGASDNVFVFDGDLTIGPGGIGEVEENGTTFWQFENPGNRSYNIFVEPLIDGFDAVVDVQNSAGQSVFEDGPVDMTTGTEEILGLALAEAGTYQIEVSGFNGMAGGYTIILVELTGDEEVVGDDLPANVFLFDTPLADIATGTAVVDAGGATFWQFENPGSHTYNIFVTPEDGFDVVVDVQNSAGQSVFEDGPVDMAVGAEEILGLFLAEAGTYRIEVRGFDGAGGRYDIRAFDLDGEGSGLGEGEVVVDTRPVTDDDMLFWSTDGIFLEGILGDSYFAGTEEAVGSTRELGASLWLFKGFEGETITIEVVPEDGLDVVVDLLVPGFVSVLDAPVDASFGTETVTLTLDRTEAYGIVVSGFEGATGNYTLRISVN
ncbi:MAG TPA: hypothetical protein VLL52_09620 [Anaerolineae bacterium]|nr:hypothetical protein [Anaerolineae bacterium]